MIIIMIMTRIPQSTQKDQRRQPKKTGAQTASEREKNTKKTISIIFISVAGIRFIPESNDSIYQVYILHAISMKLVKFHRHKWNERNRTFFITLWHTMSVNHLKCFICSVTVCLKHMYVCMHTRARARGLQCAWIQFHCGSSILFHHHHHVYEFSAPKKRGKGGDEPATMATWAVAWLTVYNCDFTSTSLRLLHVCHK